MFIKRKYQKLLKQLENYGGATLDTDGSNKTDLTGFMVSLAGFETKMKRADLNFSIFKNYLKKAKQQKAFAGYWVDHEDYDTLYIDVSVCFKKKSEAMRFAKSQNQLAIYDFKNEKTIYLNN